VGVSKYAIRISFKHEHVAKILNAEISSGNTLQTAQMNRQKDSRTARCMPHARHRKENNNNKKKENSHQK